MFQVLSFFIYWLKRVDEHSLHSPFVYNFYTQVVKSFTVDDPDIEMIRHQLLADNRVIKVKDYGAGSRVSSNVERSIDSIAKHATTPLKFSRFLTYLIHHFQFTNVLELGTSFGINTLYLSQKKSSNVLTLEGDPNIAAVAKLNFSSLQRENIEMVIGNIDDTLSKSISSKENFDLVYIDANHRYRPTLRYYEQIFPKTHQQSIVVIDDIHWSKEMNAAWRALKSKPEVTLSIDLFEAGLLFFDPKLDKEDYVLRF